MADAAPSLPLILHQASWKERPGDYAVDAYRHARWQWYGVVYGEVEVELPEGRLLLGPEESVVVPPELPRSARTPKGRPVGYFSILFSLAGPDLGAIACRSLLLPHDLRPDLDALIAEMRDEPRHDRQYLLPALVLRLLLGIARAEADEQLPPAAAPAPTHRLLRAAAAVIADHLHEDLDRGTIATAVGVSEGYLARLVRQELGCSLGAWLTGCRMERAKQLLLGGDEAIAQIAVRVGYDSFSHFSQVFRRRVGVTPSEFRRAGGKVWKAR